MKCPKCKFYNICKGRLNETVENCARFKSVEQTNEEWFCRLSTEEKAEWLSNRDEFVYDCGQRGFTPKIMDKDEWQQWLKQPHTTIKE